MPGIEVYALQRRSLHRGGGAIRAHVEQDDVLTCFFKEKGLGKMSIMPRHQKYVDYIFKGLEHKTMMN